MRSDTIVVFLKFLGTKTTNFRGIKRASLMTTDPGTRKIYDYIRKQYSPNDEKSPSSTPPKKKATPSKT